MGKFKKALAGMMAVCMLMSTLTPVMAYSADVSMAEETNPVVAGDAVFTDEEPPALENDSAEPEEPTPTEAPEEETEDGVVGSEETTPDPESTPEPTATPEEAEPGMEPTEDATEFVPFQLDDPEGGDTQEANLGDTVTFTAKGNRDDVQVVYQWQVMRKGIDYSAQGAIYDYDEDEPTWYNFPLEGITEAEQLENNPDATWPGIETYYAVVDALDAIGADSSKVSLAWRSENYALEGYTISAAEVDGHIEVYADKDNVRYTATLKEDGKFAFSDEAGATPSVPANTWQDIEGANESSYTFEVTEEDLNSVFRCKVTIVDDAYLAKCAEILKEQGAELSEDELNTEQNLYSIAMYIHSEEYDQTLAEQKGNLVETYALQPSDHPKLSSDAQWIERIMGTVLFKII